MTWKGCGIFLRKKMRRLINCCLVLLLLTSCASRHIVTTEQRTAVRDSIRLLTIMRDSVAIRDSISVITRRDTVFIERWRNHYIERWRVDTVAAVRRDTVFLEKIQTTEKTPARVSFFANWMPWILIFFLSSLLIYLLFNRLRG